MPILFTIYEEHGFFLSTWVGDISDSDLLSTYKQLFESEDYQPGFHEIADMRNVQMGGVTTQGLRRLASMVERYLAGQCEGFKTAIIAPKDLPFGLSRQYEFLSDESPERVMVFREPKEALKWIGADDSLLE